MARETWQTVKVIHCDRVGCDVAYEVKVIYPSEIMPDQPPRVISRRCSQEAECNLSDQPGCIWSGTNPFYDPFSEPESY